METPSSTTGSQGDQSHDHCSDRKQFLGRLYASGGFALTCQTIVTLHKIGTSESSSKWEILDYGILAILSKENELSLLVGDVESGELVHEFALCSSSKYSIQKDHFHTFLASDGTMCGISFADVSVAKKVSQVLRQLLPAEEELDIPQAKRQKTDDNYSEWVIINSEDVASITGDNEASAKTEGVDGGTDETDMGFFSKNKKEKKDAFKIDDISGPSFFRHLTHGLGGATETTSLEASLGQEKQAEGGTGTFERGTKRSSSFMEVSSLESHPAYQSSTMQTASSSSEIANSSSFTSIFSGSSFGMPEPPVHMSDHDTLLSQISTFDRRALHHVSPEEIAQADNKTDSRPRRQRSITSMFRNGFDLLLPKLMRQISTVATINSAGEEEGFDEFDGAVF